MPIVQSFGALQAMAEPASRGSSSSDHSISLYGANQAYAEIYRTQPNVRICVDFLARNVAHLAPLVYRRTSDTDRVRLAKHDLATWMGKPNPGTRRYRLFESLMSDLGIYFNAYWLKVRYMRERRPAIGLVRLPPEEMCVVGGLLPEKFVWTSNGRDKDFAPSEIVYFNGYNPTNKLMGLSPLETLRRILAEEAAAGDHRESYWRNAGRMEGVIEQAKDAPAWTPPQQQQFRKEWQEFSAGGAKVGQTAVLPRGMTMKPWSFSARDSEYTLGGKLRREVCAAEYHIPQPFVGILDHATFSNIKEQHKNLYQDTLGPWLEMIVQELEGQLLIECDDQTDIYVEFNIAAKMAGSFEEQASALQVSVGRPWRTVNEARAKENLPRDPNPESDKIAPQQGGPSDATANPNPTTPPAPPNDAVDDDDEDEDDADNRLVAPILRAALARQHARLNKLPAVARSSAFFTDLERWNRELTADLTPVLGDAAAARAIQANVATLTALLTVEETAA